MFFLVKNRLRRSRERALTSLLDAWGPRALIWDRFCPCCGALGLGPLFRVQAQVSRRPFALGESDSIWISIGPHELLVWSRYVLSLLSFSCATRSAVEVATPSFGKPMMSVKLALKVFLVDKFVKLVLLFLRQRCFKAEVNTDSKKRNEEILSKGAPLRLASAVAR